MNIFRRASIKRKQVLIIMAITSVALLLASAGFTVYEIVTFRAAMVRNLSILAEIVGNNTSSALDFKDSNAAQETLSALKAEPHIVGACVYAADGRVFATYRRADAGTAFIPPAKSPVNGHAFRNGNLTLSRFVFSKDDVVGTVFLVSDICELYSRLGQYAIIVAIVLVLTLVVALALSSALQRFISEPIGRLAAAARTAGQNQDYSIRVEKHNPDEIGVLIDGFNGMLEQIQKRDMDLQKARDVLETRVKERTSELAETNAALQKENLERKQAEAEARRNEELYRRAADEARTLSQAVEQSPASIVITDPSGRITYVNPKFTEVSGYSSQQVVGQFPRMLKSGETPPEEYKRLWETITAGGEWRGLFHNRKKNGELFWESACIAPVFNEAGKITHYLAVKEDITERKLAEEELKLKNAILSTQQEISLDGILVDDENSKIVSYNQRLIDMWGIPPEFTEGRADDLMLSFVANQTADPAAFLQRVHYLLEHSHEISREEILLKDGRVFDRYSAPMIGADGRHYGRVRFFRDITERRQAEKALRSQEERTRLMIDQAFDAVVTADYDYRIIGWNRQAEKMLGWDRDAILGTSMFDTIIPPGRREERRAILDRFHATGEWPDRNRLIQTTELRRDGREIPVELTITPVRIGDTFIFTLFLRDITERKQAEAALARERHLLESLLDNSQDYIYFKDRQSRFVRCSKALSRWCAGSVAELIGKTDFDLFAEEHARAAFEDEQEIIRTGIPLIGKIEKEVAKDGSESWALTSKMPLRDEAGEIAGTFGISKDITAMKQAEAELERTHKELVQASRQAGMAEVATSVLHNVGNVLNSINVAVSLVDERVRKSRVSDVGRLAKLLEEHARDRAAFLTSDPKGQMVPEFLSQLAERLCEEQTAMIEELASLRMNVDHVKEIIAMQQNYARVAGVFETLELTALIEDALRMNEGAFARHEIKVERDYSLVPPVCTDKHKVLQILINLARNAKYACDDSGRSDKKIIMRANHEEGRVKISVIDNGIGIPPENLIRIFNHGFTTRRNGHGFGLHSGALAARELGGSLTVCSEGLGRGAAFTLELPVEPPPDTQFATAQDRRKNKSASHSTNLCPKN